jgi:hypothetical protein
MPASLLFLKTSGMHVMAHFITACIFQKGIKTIKIDKAAMDYYMRLTSLYSQFRAVGVNYNQVVKILYQNFTDKKASACLYKLEKQTSELAVLCQRIIQLTEEFEKTYLKD